MSKARTPPVEDDPGLIRAVAGGDVRAFEAIYDRHSGQVFGLALRITGRPRAAEEATQDAFLSLWRTASSYDVTRGALSTWLLSIVRNRSIDWLRREARHDRDLEIDDALVERLQAADCTEREVADREQSRHARELLAGLPSRQRQVIELAFFNGLTQSEIAAKLNAPLGTIKSRQRLALTKLHQALIGPRELALTA
jgi:RNA polymerase sigma-70 factor (ECF subfamily)